MTVVISPKMVEFGGCDDLVMASNRDHELFCFHVLEELFDCPRNRFYWIEASDRQWKDGSGTRVEITFMLGLSIDIEYSIDDGAYEGFLYKEAIIERALRKLGVLRDGKSKVVYFRLLYEE